MIGDLRREDLGTDRDERSPQRYPLVAVNPDCAACDIADELAVASGCGTDGWYCRRDCRQEGAHVHREHRVCLHFGIEVVS